MKWEQYFSALREVVKMNSSVFMTHSDTIAVWGSQSIEVGEGRLYSLVIRTSHSTAIRRSSTDFSLKINTSQKKPCYFSGLPLLWTNSIFPVEITYSQCNLCSSPDRPSKTLGLTYRDYDCKNGTEPKLWYLAFGSHWEIFCSPKPCGPFQEERFSLEDNHYLVHRKSTGCSTP